MGSRIRTLQMQARELGRLRTGTFEKPAGGKGRPVRSKNDATASIDSGGLERFVRVIE